MENKAADHPITYPKGTIVHDEVFGGMEINVDVDKNIHVRQTISKRGRKQIEVARLIHDKILGDSWEIVDPFCTIASDAVKIFSKWKYENLS